MDDSFIVEMETVDPKTVCVWGKVPLVSVRDKRCTNNIWLEPLILLLTAGVDIVTGCINYLF